MDCNCKKDGKIVEDGKIKYWRYWCWHKACWVFEVLPNQDLKGNQERLKKGEEN